MTFDYHLRMLLVVSSFIGTILTLTDRAQAHPHAWIVMNSTLQFNEAGSATGLYLEWRFDQGYSKVAVEGLDANKDGYYDSSELNPLTKGNITSLKEYDYFAYVKAGGKKIDYKTVTEYSEYFANGHLTMSFTIPFKSAIDPLKQKLQFKLYDPTFYIAMDFQKNNPVGTSGKLPANCKIELKPVSSDQEIDKKRDQLATKGKEWTPEPQEEFGALFAQTVVIACTEKTALK